MLVKFASCFDPHTDNGCYVTDMDGDTIDVSPRNFGVLFSLIHYGHKPGSIKYLNSSDRYNYYEVEVTEQDWEKLQNQDFTW